MRFLYFIGCLVGGWILLRYSKWFVDSTGIRFAFAENFFGTGGTYFIVKILGLAVIASGFYLLFS